MNMISMENTFLQHAGTTFSAMRSANHGATTATFLGASSYLGSDARLGGWETDCVPPDQMGIMFRTHMFLGKHIMNRPIHVMESF